MSALFCMAVVVTPRKRDLGFLHSSPRSGRGAHAKSAIAGYRAELDMAQLLATHDWRGSSYTATRWRKTVSPPFQPVNSIISTAMTERLNPKGTTALVP